MKTELNPKPKFCYVCGNSLKMTKHTDYRDYYECITGHKFGFTQRDNMGDCYLLAGLRDMKLKLMGEAMKAAT